MEGYPLQGYQAPDYFNSTCSTIDYTDITTVNDTTIMNTISPIKTDSYPTMVHLKEDLINLLKSGEPQGEIEPDEMEFLNQVSDTFIEFMKRFEIQKERLNQAETEMKDKIKETKQNIHTLETFINFLQTLTLDRDQTEPIVSQLIQVTQSLEMKQSIDQAKQRFIQQKRLFSKYLSIVKLINQMNTGSTCSICLCDNVSVYFDPCGHTCCSECVEKNKTNRCPLCRKDIIQTRKLYFS